MTEPNIPVPAPVQSATKAVAATITTSLGVITLFGTSIDDGVLTWGEAGVLIGAVATAVSTIAAVWRFPNRPR